MSDRYELSIINNASSSSSGGSQVFDHDGGPLYVALQGNFDGATISLYATLDRTSSSPTYGLATDILTSNTISVANGTTDVVYSSQLYLPPCKFKFESSNVGTSTNVTAVFGNVV